MQHVAECRKKNPGKSLKDILKLAKKSYKKSSTKKMSSTSTRKKQKTRKQRKSRKSKKSKK
jgi:hypothetical protein